MGYRDLTDTQVVSLGYGKEKVASLVLTLRSYYVESLPVVCLSTLRVCSSALWCVSSV